MDFITKLPVSEGHDMIMVIVDRLTKYAYMIPTTETIDAGQMANIVLRHVVANHGMPSRITSDRDKLFTSNMWQSFADQMGIELRLSTAYHPQTNGQTERVNQTLKQYLRHYVNYQQNDWAGLLPTAQLAYNNAAHSTTNETPFFANYGYHPVVYGEPIGKTAVAESARLKATGLKQLHLQLSRDIDFVNLRMKKYYDQQHEEGPDLRRGEKVYLLRRNIKTKRPSDKLDHLRLGPFKIEEKLGPVSYRLKLPYSMRKLHPVFHISLLEPAPENAELAMNVEIAEETENEYEVEEIL
jgi:transposase InsO family protein